MDGTGTPAQAAAPPPTKASVDTVGLGGFRLAPSLATLETLAALCGFTPEDFRPAAPQKSNSKLGARETLLVIDTASEDLDDAGKGGHSRPDRWALGTTRTEWPNRRRSSSTGCFGEWRTSHLLRSAWMMWSVIRRLSVTH